MHGLKQFSILLAAITVVYGACDRQAVATCQAPMAQIGKDGTPNQGELCGLYTELTTCLAPLRTACETDASWQPISMMESSYGPMCGGTGGSGGSGGGSDEPMCKQANLMSCFTPLSAVNIEDFSGYPTASQVGTICGASESFSQCTKPLMEDCKKSGNDVAKQVVESVNMVVGLFGLFCGEHKANFLKYAAECFEKNSYPEDSKKCLTEVPKDSSGQPKSETQEEECARELASFDCHVDLTKKLCTDDAFNFVQNVKGDYMKTVAPRCPTSGAMRLGAQMWIYLSIILAAVFLY